MQRHPWPQCESAGFQARELAKQRSFNGMKSLDFRRVASRSVYIGCRGSAEKLAWNSTTARLITFN